MGFRFRRSVRIAPGLRINFGKTGMSLTAGGRGGSMTFGPRGVYSNWGIPGTGISYRSRIGGGTGQARRSPAVSSGPVEIAAKLRFDDQGYLVACDENGDKLPPKYTKLAIEQHPGLVKDLLREKCEEFNADVRSVLEIHRVTPPLEAFATFPDEDYPKGRPSLPEPRRVFFLAKLLPFLKRRVEAENERRREQYEADLSQWEQGKAAFEQEKSRFRQQFEVGRFHDASVMEEFLEKVLQGIGWPRETFVNFDIRRDGRQVLVDVDLPEIEDLPDTSAEISKTGRKVNFKKRSETQRRKDYMVHVHGIGFRMLGTVFAALPACSEVVVSAYSQRNDAATGNTNDEYLYSVRAERAEWERINFSNLEQVDVVECLGRFEIVREMTKTGIFKAIVPFAG
ncbi:MAG: DUF4236 domain-containing protein [Desulfovibrionaceae bacterium]